MSDRERFVDDVIDRALAACEAQPLEGFEERLIAKLRAGIDAGAAPRRSWSAWRWAAVPLGLALLVAMVAWWPSRREAPPPRLSANRTLEDPSAPDRPQGRGPDRPELRRSEPPRAVPPDLSSSARETAPGVPAARRSTPGRPGARPEPPSAPRLAQFPAPVQLSEAERLALHWAASVPEAGQLLALQDRGFTPLQVSAITIDPLPPPGIEQEPLP